MKNNLARRQGFSLLELLVAVAILALVMVPIALFYSRALQAVEAASIRNRALELAQERINEMKGMPYEMIRANTQPGSEDVALAVGSGYAEDSDFNDYQSFMWFYPLPLGYNPYIPDTQGYDNTPDISRRAGNFYGDDPSSGVMPVAPHVNTRADGGNPLYEYEPIGFYKNLRRTGDFRTTDPRTSPVFEKPRGAGVDYFRVGTEYRSDLYSVYGRRTIILDVVPDPADDDTDIYPVDSPLDGGASALNPYPPAKGPLNKFQVRSKYGMRGKLVTVQVFWLSNRVPERYLRPDEIEMVDLKTFIPASNAENAVDIESDLLTSNDFLFISNPPS
ncbi:MAG: hypothetical protein A2Y63_01140 [Candidatus Riflebacteria bacterium RBG_13_59_9]|nr:MAG: hypothetical protein A2Y63_01140 [Candidatus Riflebacteria bacterium RBG_13_59_9]